MTVYEAQSERIWFLQLKNRHLQEKIRDYESGEMYVRMKEEFQKAIRQANRETLRMKKEAADAHAQAVSVRNLWMEMYETAEKEYLAKIDSLERENRTLKEKLHEKTDAYYSLGAQLGEEKAKNQKLNAQLHKDYENSSKPSSRKPEHKKIQNSREKSGKKRGAQPGHKPQPRKRQEATSCVEIEPQAEFLDTGKYRPAGTDAVRQLVKISVNLEVVEYSTPEFIEKATGRKKHSAFPKGIDNDVNYDGTVKAFLFLLNADCNVSICKCRDFLSQLTQGKLNISAGMINGLGHEFASRTGKEREECFRKLLASPVMHADFTNGRMDGKSRQIFVCSAGGNVMYFSREHKGHQGIKDSPAELYEGILITDHDKTFYSYGKKHQECLAHVLRYLKGAAENEPDYKWHTQMRELLQEMIHYRNSIGEEEPIDPQKTSRFEVRFDEIIRKGKGEYE